MFSLVFRSIILLPILREFTSSHWIAMFDSFYRSGALVFGGGHVVLPLLESEVVPSGWVSKETFLQAMGRLKLYLVHYLLSQPI